MARKEKAFDIVCHDGFKPKEKLCAISDGKGVQVLVEGETRDILALYSAITHALLEADVDIEDIAQAVAIAMHEAK
jgi:hypothetical protein